MAKYHGVPKIIKETLYIILIALIGVLGIIFAVSYLNLFNSGFFYEYHTPITIISVVIITTMTILSIIFYKQSKQFVYKLFFLIVSFVLLVLVAMYFLKKTDYLDKFSSVESFRDYISSFGALAVFFFILLQFLQVVVLPIPSFVTVGAGVLLFGPLKGAIFSAIGIILGSIVGFTIGRIFGYKVAKWLVGEDSLNKALNLIKGKDKVVLTFIMLFPFFPDDVICFVAGITSISPTFFIVMIFITRTITVFVSSYSFSGSIIPYNTWWGILIWLIIFAVTIVLSVIIYKNSDKIDKILSRKKKD